MTLLEEFKAHFVNNGIKLPINFNYSSEKNEDCIVLWHYDGTPNMVARNSKIQITVKMSDMKDCENMANYIYDILYPIGQYKKVIAINGKNMHITPLQEPFYNLKDDNNRHCYVFNINVDYGREAAIVQPST